MHACMQDLGNFRQGRKPNAKRSWNRWVQFVVLMVTVLTCTRAAYRCVDTSEITFQVKGGGAGRMGRGCI